MRSRRVWIIFIGLAALTTSGIFVYERNNSIPVKLRKMEAPGTSLRYDVVRDYPHDSGAYTQGLIYLDGYLYESTGMTRRSTLRKVRLETGETIQKRLVNPRDFGEGLTEWRGRLIQLTPRRRGSEPIWHLRVFFEDIQRHFGDKVGVTYDTESLEPKSSFTYPGEGWGLTHDDHQLILSDGSSKLRFLDPETFGEVGSLEVFDGINPVKNLNELEFVAGKIYANVLPQDRIAIIQADTGQVTGWIDLSKLRTQMPQLPQEPLRPVMNGIAYDAAGRRLFVTGKFWPKLFEIRVTF